MHNNSKKRPVKNTSQELGFDNVEPKTIKESFNEAPCLISEEELTGAETERLKVLVKTIFE